MQINAAISTRPGKGGGEEPGEQGVGREKWDNYIFAFARCLASQSSPEQCWCVNTFSYEEGLFYPPGKCNSLSLERLCKTQRVQNTGIHPLKTEPRRPPWKAASPLQEVVFSFPQNLGAFRRFSKGLELKSSWSERGISKSQLHTGADTTQGQGHTPGSELHSV